MYSLPYIIFVVIFSLLAYLSFQYRSVEKSNYYILFLLYLFFLGFRGYVGSDFFMYYEVFQNLPVFDGKWSYQLLSDVTIEKGFLLYMTLVKSIFNDYSFFVFANTFINIICILVFLRRYSSNVALSLIVFLEIGGLIFETDVLRNMKSVLLFILSIKYIEQRRLLPFLAFNLIGFSMHSSAIIYLPMYWLINRPIGLKTFWVLFVLGNIVYLGKIHILSIAVTPFLSLLGGRFELLSNNYLDTGIVSDYGFTMGFFLRITVALMISYYYERIKALHSYNIIFINCIFIYLLLFCYFSEIRILAIRMTNLFFFSYAVIIPQFVYLFRIRSNQIIYIGIVCLISILKVNGKINTPIYEYDSVLFEHKDAYERKINIDDFYIGLE